jgi:hypothetical protein
MDCLKVSREQVVSRAIQIAREPGDAARVAHILFSLKTLVPSESPERERISNLLSSLTVRILRTVVRTRDGLAYLRRGVSYHGTAHTMWGQRTGYWYSYAASTVDALVALLTR